MFVHGAKKYAPEKAFTIIHGSFYVHATLEIQKRVTKMRGAESDKG